MTMYIIKLKAVAAATAVNQCRTVALNDNSLVIPPATVHGLITEAERHRQVYAEGCKPESIIATVTAPADKLALNDKVKPSEGIRFRALLKQHSTGGIQVNGGVAA